MSTRISCVLVLLAFAFPLEAQTISSVSLSSPSTPVFRAIDYPGAVATIANGINGTAKVVGCYTDKLGNMHGFMFSNGKFQTIDYPHSSYNAAYGINDTGQIVGTFSTSFQVGYLYTNGQFNILNFYGDSLAIGVNKLGAIVGAYFDPTIIHGYLSQRPRFTTLDYPGAIRTLAEGVNNSTTVVGIWRDVNNVLHGFMWNNGSFTPIDVPGATATYAFGINSSGKIVGSYNDSAGIAHGFMLQNGSFTTVDFPGSSATQIEGINDFDMIVGNYTDGSGTVHGFFGHR